MARAVSVSVLRPRVRRCSGVRWTSPVARRRARGHRPAPRQRPGGHPVPMQDRGPCGDGTVAWWSAGRIGAGRQGRGCPDQQGGEKAGPQACVRRTRSRRGGTGMEHRKGPRIRRREPAATHQARRPCAGRIRTAGVSAGVQAGARRLGNRRWQRGGLPPEGQGSAVVGGARSGGRWHGTRDRKRDRAGLYRPASSAPPSGCARAHPHLTRQRPKRTRSRGSTRPTGW